MPSARMKFTDAAVPCLMRLRALRAEMPGRLRCSPRHWNKPLVD